MELTGCTVRNNSGIADQLFGLSATPIIRLMDCDLFEYCEIERSSGQLRELLPGQKSVPLGSTNGYIHYADLPQQQISYYDDL